MNSQESSIPQTGNDGAVLPKEAQEAVARVAASATFEKSYRLRAFFLYVCKCALENDPEAATEQQIGIHVFGRPPGYSPNEDNIVRAQARLLRLKLEHHFAHEGKDEPILITVPKGQYLPAFARRPEPERLPSLPPAAPPEPPPAQEGPRQWRWILVAVLGVVLIAVLARGPWFRSAGPSAPPEAAPGASGTAVAPATPAPPGGPVPSAPGGREVRILAGYTGEPFVDSFGRRWEADRYFSGGSAQPGPANLFPPVPEPRLFKTMREAPSQDLLVPQTEREFRYDIPVPPGAYELRLYFADPMRSSSPAGVDSQNLRHFDIKLNGQVLLTSYDPVASAGAAAADVQAFRDVTPAADGQVHLRFDSGPERPFVSAIELTPGTPGRLRPIRISAKSSGFVDADGTAWSADNYFIHGLKASYSNPASGPKVSPLYIDERVGNFGYAIPVPPGSYTVKLHFLESFFSPLIPAAKCHGKGCRVFDVSCNGVSLLSEFDVFQAAQGAFRPVVRTFTGLRPNGQGKLLLSFFPRVNYAEVRAIEVIDEAR